MATIRDIAEKAGVSAGAVSRILNNDASLNVAPETRSAVLKIAKSMGYKKKKRSNTPSKSAFRMGMVQWFSAEAELKDTYYLRLRQGVEDFCNQNAIDIVRIFPEDAQSGESFKDIDGLICLGKFSKKEIKNFIGICRNIVFLDMEIDAPITSLSMDFEQAVYDALDYFAEHGHTEIGFLGGQEYVGDHIGEKEALTDPRYYAYQKYMEHRDLDGSSYVEIGSFTSQSGYEMMSRMLDKKKTPTAVFAASDAIAFGAMKAIQERGLKIPEDISIIGFNDEETSAFMNPPLSTVHAPAYDMGQHGANLVYVASNLKISTPLRAKIPCNLIIRESVK